MKKKLRKSELDNDEEDADIFEPDLNPDETEETISDEEDDDFDL